MWNDLELPERSLVSFTTRDLFAVNGAPFDTGCTLSLVVKRIEMVSKSLLLLECLLTFLVCCNIPHPWRLPVRVHCLRNCRLRLRRHRLAGCLVLCQGKRQHCVLVALRRLRHGVHELELRARLDQCR